MSRRSTFGVLVMSTIATCALGCGDDCDVEDALINSTMLCLDLPSFDEELASVRANGGVAVVASRTALPEPTEPALWADESGLFLAHGREVATYEVIDALGESVGSELNVIAWNGQRYAARASSRPVCAGPNAVRLRCDLETSRHEFGPDLNVITLLPEGDRWFLTHRARVIDDAVRVGSDEETIPLDSIRR